MEIKRKDGEGPVSPVEKIYRVKPVERKIGPPDAESAEPVSIRRMLERMLKKTIALIGDLETGYGPDLSAREERLKNLKSARAKLEAQLQEME